MHVGCIILCLAGALADYHQMEADAEQAAVKSAYAEARALYSSALEAARRSSGPRSLDVGRLLSRLALMMEMQGELTGPEPYYQQAVKILEAPSMELPAELATALELYAGLLGKQGKTAEAEKLRARARPIRLREVEALVAGIPAAVDSRQERALGCGVNGAHIYKKVEQEYSPVARMAKLQGTVAMTIEVGVDGRVRSLKLFRGLGLGLDEKAVEALLQWRFCPMIKDGQAVPFPASIELAFRIL